METHPLHSSKMGDKALISSSHHRRYGSQTISVPFLWERKPGMAKTDWIPKPIPSVSAKLPEAKPISSGEKAIVPPLKLVISVPFRWEEKPGKPILNPCSSILPVAFSFINPSINDSFSSDQNYPSFHGSSNKGESWCSASDTMSDSCSSEMGNELEAKGSTRYRSRLVKRTITLGELILLSRKLSYPKNADFLRKHRFFSMEIIRKTPLACFPFGTNHQKK